MTAQVYAVVTAVVVSATVSFIALKIIDVLIGLRVSEESEREGLDTTEHGERAYHA
jgi:Amt family ammonium transporter